MMYVEIHITAIFILVTLKVRVQKERFTLPKLMLPKAFIQNASAG
jgi:hypothetical protein